MISRIVFGNTSHPTKPEPKNETPQPPETPPIRKNLLRGDVFEVFRNKSIEKGGEQDDKVATYQGSD